MSQQPRKSDNPKSGLESPAAEFAGGGLYGWRRMRHPVRMKAAKNSWIRLGLALGSGTRRELEWELPLLRLERKEQPWWVPPPPQQQQQQQQQQEPKRRQRELQSQW